MFTKETLFMKTEGMSEIERGGSETLWNGCGHGLHGLVI
jgi:hypothetical protein